MNEQVVTFTCSFVFIKLPKKNTINYFQGKSIQATALLKTTDGGKTWAEIKPVVGP
jgi:photosystem II stability/assembly factor-like uncharacterized protein